MEKLGLKANKPLKSTINFPQFTSYGQSNQFRKTVTFHSNKKRLKVKKIIRFILFVT